MEELGLFKRIIAKAFSIPITDGQTIRDTFAEWFGIGKQENYAGWVAACIHVWGTYFAKAKFRLYETRDGNPIELENHLFNQLLRKPNDFQTWWEQKFLSAIFFAVYGNAYFLKLRNARGLWIQWTMLRPDLVKPLSSRESYITGYEYDLGYKRIPIAKEDMIHFRFPNPDSFVEGRPLIANIMNQIEVDNFQTKYQKKFYKEGGFVGQMFVSKNEMSKSSFERMKAELQNKYGGESNAFKVALLEQIEPAKAAYSIKDMDITNQRQLTRDEILAGFQVPKILLGIGESINRATAEASIYQFTSGIVDPVLSYFDEVLSLHLKEEFNNPLLSIVHDSLAPKDIALWSEVNAAKFSVGAITINEMRTEDGYAKFAYPLADVSLINVGGAVVRLDTGEQLGQVPNNVQPKVQPKEQPKKNFEPMNKNIADLKWKQFDRRHKNLMKLLSGDINKFFDGQEERILRKLDSEKNWSENPLFKRNRESFKVLDKSVPGFINIFENEDEKIIWMAMIENHFARAMEQGFYLSNGGTLDVQLFRNQIQALINASTSVNETTKKELLKASENITEADIRSFVKDYYKNAKDTRTPKIAITSVTGAFNAGALIGLIKSGAKNKTWITQRDGKERDAHFMADGQTVGINEPFFVMNEFLQYPGDSSASAGNITNCRCFMMGD